MKQGRQKKWERCGRHGVKDPLQKTPRGYKEAGRGEVWPKEEELLAVGRRFANFS